MQWIDVAKLALAPGFVAAITLLGRRAGPEIAGFLAALPVVGGPILGLIVLAHGNTFGAAAALGSAIGVVPTMLFALAFAHWAPRLPPLACLGAAYAVYFAATGVAIAVPTHWLFPIVAPAVSWFFILRAFPDHEASQPMGVPWRWDLPMRVGATSLLVATITALARALGPSVAGVLTPFPIITATLALFTHSQAGPVHAAILLRSLVRGLASFIAFFWVVAYLLPQTSAALAFTGAVLVCLACHLLIRHLAIGAPQPAGRGQRR